ncbi:class I SAM-dependent methyltransferase [Pontibacter pudoricolor]|uniref:class I SAM-dependent methyltransferase n=1 Tax=Pontibacter pudoricolor TaxID=2694930 RepID=UPI001390BBC8|nr:methyltransferase domain-containing protein [Pontibacter pudoricolor]
MMKTLLKKIPLIKKFTDAKTELVKQNYLLRLKREQLENENSLLRKELKISKTKCQVLSSDSIKLVVGSGGIQIDGWILTDIDTLDVSNYEDWKRYFREGSVDTVFSEHVWEHLDVEQTDKANLNIYKYLKEGGRLRIAVPDGLHPKPSYIDYVKPGGNGPGADDHKILYTYKSMTESLTKAGFTVDLLEYWDEAGNFNFNSYDENYGKVMRSSKHDKSNVGGKLEYTSLIVDAIK